MSPSEDSGIGPATDLDLLIVGAGPSGLALALAAARHDLAFRIVDRAPAPSEHSKALGVMPRTLEIFDQAGIADEAWSRGRPLESGRIHADGRVVGGIRFDDTGSRFGPLILAQSETERILAGALESLGGVVERGVEWVGFEEGPDGVVSSLRDAGAERAVRSRWLAGCDGAHSDVRHALGLDFEGAEYAEDFVLADVRIDAPLEEGVAHAFFRGPDFLVALPMTGRRRFRLIATRPPGVEDGGEPDLAEFERLFEEVAGVDAPVSDPVWLARFRLHRRIVPTFRRGRAFLLGDAAHIHSPIGAQGMNAGVQDAWNLGWKLGRVARGGAGARLLDSYDAERRPVDEAIVRWTDVAFRAAMGQSAPARWARRLAPRVGLKSRRLRARLVRAVSMIGHGYRDSPIVGEGEGADFDGGPRPGDRAPDAPLAEPGGGRGSIHALLREPRHLLLGFGRADGADPEAFAERAAASPVGRPTLRWIAAPGRAPALGDPATSLHDVDGRAFRAYGIRDRGLYLIRPDGHVAWRGPLDPAPFLRFLDRYR